ncbi:Tn3 family transposase [Enterobacter hormaechei]|uniref:Tn3 family transposase n=1 Tax=Enterobacter hormaechei TaxID=158836 RepID=UPI00388D7E4C
MLLTTTSITRQPSYPSSGTTTSEDVIHASADGQKFEARRETFKTRYSSKYFGTQKVFLP